MIDLAREHSNEDEHEDKADYCKNQHENALHEACHHVLGLMVNLFYFCVGLLNVLHLKVANFLNHRFILLKLLLEAFGERLHARDHLQHILLQFYSLLSLVPLYLIIVNSARRLLRLRLIQVSLLQLYSIIINTRHDQSIEDFR